MSQTQIHTQTVLSRDQVAEHLGIGTEVLFRYEARGLVQPLRSGETEGYGPGEIRRLWSILTLQRDLGVNLAGVEAILRLRAHMEGLHRRLERLATEIEEVLDLVEQEDLDA